MFRYINIRKRLSPPDTDPSVFQLIYTSEVLFVWQITKRFSCAFFHSKKRGLYFFLSWKGSDIFFLLQLQLIRIFDESAKFYESDEANNAIVVNTTYKQKWNNIDKIYARNRIYVRDLS